MKKLLMTGTCVAVACAGLLATAAAQPAPTPRTVNGAPAAESAAVPNDYVIGPEDILTIIFWRDKELSGDVVVRPDGKISLPLVNDLQAAGLTPEQLKASLEEAASKYIEEPNATVMVKDIRSRKVFVLGQVVRPGTVQLTREMRVLELIAEVGGLLEYANRKNITIVRNENGRERRLRFNYDEVLKGQKLQQNVLLQPGDMVVVR